MQRVISLLLIALLFINKVIKKLRANSFRMRIRKMIIQFLERVYVKRKIAHKVWQNPKKDRKEIQFIHLIWLRRNKIQRRESLIKDSKIVKVQLLLYKKTNLLLKIWTIISILRIFKIVSHLKTLEISFRCRRATLNRQLPTDNYNFQHRSQVSHSVDRDS